MRKSSLTKLWPIAALLTAGLAVTILVLVTLRPPHIPTAVGPFLIKIPGALPPIAFAQADSADIAADTTGGYDYDLDEDKNDIVRMGEDIEIGPQQTVSGDVVAIGGRATIYGHVVGDVVSIGGGITLKSGCIVDGDAVVVGGVMDREEGATVRGQNVSVAGIPKGLGKWWGPQIDHRHRVTSGASAAVCIWRDLLRYVAFFVVGLILCLALPHKRRAVRSTLRSRFWMSLLVGFGSLIGLAVGLVLLCITCVGIIVAVPAALASIVVIAAAGAAGFALLGELITHREPKEEGRWLASLALGLLPVFVIHLLGRVLLCNADGGGAVVIGNALVGISKTAWAVLILGGVGALVLSRMGTRDPSQPPLPPLWASLTGVPVPPSGPVPPGNLPPTYGQGSGQPWTPYGQGGPQPGSQQQGGAPGHGSGWEPPVPPKPPGS